MGSKSKHGRWYHTSTFKYLGLETNRTRLDKLLITNQESFKNRDDIRWRWLHEQITGCKTYSHLPPQEELSLYHPKTIYKQEQQNQLYTAITMDNYS